MNTKIKLALISFFFWIAPIHADHSVVTYHFSGGRFGDNLLSYLHAKWFSYKNDVPLLYKPFPYSSHLVLHDQEIQYRNRTLRKKLGLRPWFRVPAEKWSFYSKIPFFSFCFQCAYFPESPEELEGGNFASFEVDWKDPKFREILTKLVAPKETLNLTKPPPGFFSVAIHARDGGGFDKGSYRFEMPLKFPPISFYIDGLKKVLALFPNQPIYCHLFTDAKNPERILQEIRQSLPSDAPIQFGYRTGNNQHDLNVLEDFFSLLEFDALIRPQSNYSIIPSLLKDYAFVYSPKKFSCQNSIVLITETETQINYKRSLK